MPRLGGIEGAIHMAWFRARFTYHDIYELSGEALARRGFKLLLADLDNTLAPYGVPLPDEKLKAWRDDLNAHGVTLFILSNNRHESRPRIFAQALDVPFIGHAGKPKTPSFVKAMEQMGVTKEQTAIVGDQVFTDVLGGEPGANLPFRIGNIYLGLIIKSNKTRRIKRKTRSSK